MRVQSFVLSFQFRNGMSVFSVVQRELQPAVQSQSKLSAINTVAPYCTGLNHPQCNAGHGSTVSGIHPHIINLPLFQNHWLSPLSRISERERERERERVRVRWFNDLGFLAHYHGVLWGGGTMPDRTRSEYDATWIQVARRFNKNVHTVTQLILQKTVNESKMRQTKQTTAES